jgi:hypothetical protein
MTGKFDFSS